MPENDEGYFAARAEDALFVKVAGAANLSNAPDFDLFASSEIDNGVTRICVDLGACTGMDSTFMGTLVGLGKRCDAAGGELVLVNAEGTNRRLLDMLGLSSVLPVLPRREVPELQYVRVAEISTQDVVKRMERVKAAHQHLVGLSDRNREQFSAFLEALEGDLEKQRERIRRRSSTSQALEAKEGEEKDAGEAGDGGQAPDLDADPPAPGE